MITVKIEPRITIDALTRKPHLTLVVTQSPEGSNDPKIGDVWGVKGSPAHAAVPSLENALNLYDAYAKFVTGLPKMEQVKERLKQQWQGAQRELKRVEMEREGGAIAA